MKEITRYSFPIRVIHWVMVVIVFGALGASMLMDHVKAETVNSWLIQTHVAFGYLTLQMVILRLVVRWMSKLPEGVGSEWEIEAAKWGHIALYCMMVLTPLLGIITFLANGWEVSIFGMMPLPNPIEDAEWLAWAAKETHELFGNFFYFLLAVHIGAVIFHEKLMDEPVMQRIGFKMPKRSKTDADA